MSYADDVAAKKRRGRRPGWSSAAQELVNRVFVYGSLRQGQSARSLIADYLAGAQPATMPGTLYALPDGYPVITEGDNPVVGELLELSDLTAALPLLDAYEGDDYIRTLRQATLRDGTEVWSWVYTNARPELLANAVLIESGDWDEFVTETLFT